MSRRQRIQEELLEKEERIALWETKHGTPVTLDQFDEEVY